MIVLLRATLATLVAVLGCWWGVSPASAGGREDRPSAVPADCEAFNLRDAAAVRERAAAVTDVFAGEVRSARPRSRTGGDGRDNDGTAGPNDAPRQDPDYQVNRWDHVVVVKKPFRGELRGGEEVRVVTLPRTADDGLGQLRVDEWYLFFVSRSPGTDTLLAEACSGTQQLVGGLGSGLQATLVEILAEPAAEQEPDVRLTAPDDGAASAPSFSRLAAPGAALVLIGVLGLLLLARVGRRR